VAVLSEDPELSIMLALESIRATPQGSTPSPEGVRTLREAVLTNRLVARFDGFGNYARISPDGSIMYYADDEANTVIAVQVDTGEELWSSDPIPVGGVGRVEISPDGEMVSVQVHQPGDHQIRVFGASDGLVIATLSPGDGCSGTDFEGLSAIGGFSPGGQWFSVFTGMAGCGEVAGEGWISVYDTSTWDESFQLNTDDGLVFSAYFSTDATRVLLTSHGGTAELRSFPDLELINTLDNMFIAAVLSPDGQRIATVENGPRGPFLADSTTGDLINSLSHADDTFAYVEPFVFSGDGSKLVVAAIGRDYFFNGVDGAFLGTLATGQTISSSFTADGSQLLTTTLGTPLIWNLTTGHPIAGDGLTGDWINPEQATSGPHLAVNVIDFEGDEWVLALLDPVSGFVVESRNEWGSQLADGRFVTVGWEGSYESYTVGPLEIWDPTDDTTSVLGGCVVHGEDDQISERNCPDGELFFAGSEFGALSVAVSDRDGSVFAAQSSDDQSLVVVWDAESLSRISEFPIPKEQTLVGMTDTWVVASVTDKLVVYGFGGDVITTVDLAVAGGPPFFGSVEFSPDESLLLTRDAAGTVYVYETASWERVAAWEAHPGVIRGWHLSKDGQRLATAGEEGFVHIWELGPLYLGETPEAPVLIIPVVGRPSDVVWLSDEQLAVFLIDRGTGARWFTVLLDTEDLVDDARTRLTRGFTASECAIYLIENCPVTLEEIRSR
jgi:WD40 repeat protein